ncbi:patatin-like phospholipase family protein [Lentzea sp. NBC_00516]|uniref:patatin-like phospholipase family protein n=1 Tax=Lentzea sp. NBC_00516 TaxID=2903582 RepID=UPI002E8089CA|nr:patatin-like phospholipase family protein [Lentzea sp. NBC_00516]WUD27356.1 patatin-like phospholipase family protein [Lentzea sp. NBC_00516]
MSVVMTLGGGGMLGTAWQAGLLHGIQESGVSLAAVDAVIGTSAGSIVGALLRTGVHLGPELVERLQASAASLAASQAPAGGTHPGRDPVAVLLNAMAAVDTTDPHMSARRLGEEALLAATIPENTYCAAFEALVGREWPVGFCCASTEVATGRVRALNASTGVPLFVAVAASAAIPMVFPSVRVRGMPYFDGGVIDSLNLDLATGHDAVIAVSCFSLTGDDEGQQLQIGLDAARAALHRIRTSVPIVELIEPDAAFATLSRGGAAAMDIGLMSEAHSAGQRWGRECAPRVHAVLAR